MPPNIARLVEILREMDRQQAKTLALGDREIAWLWYRADIETILELAPGTLDTGEYDPSATG